VARQKKGVNVEPIIFVRTKKKEKTIRDNSTPNHKTYLVNQMENPEFAAEWERLELEYQKALTDLQKGGF